MSSALWRLSTRLKPGIDLYHTSMRCRGLSTFRSEDVNSNQVSVDILDGGNSLSLSFSPHQTSVFHAAWLWSTDPALVHPSSGQRILAPYSGWSLQSAQIVTNPFESPPTGSHHPVSGLYNTQVPSDGVHLALQVDWQSSQASRSTLYDLGWLWRCRYDDDAFRERRLATEVTPANCIRRGTELQRVKYDLSESARWNMLQAIFDDGAVLVTGVQYDHDATGEPLVGTLGRALSGGDLSHGQLYDDVFHVRTAPNAHNLAYTNVALAPHQDLAYYESKPGLQLLHCVSNRGVHGGESLLIDALAAAHAFRGIAPDLYQVLLDCEATFLKQRKGADMVYRRPHIMQDSEGVVVAVHWSPPFMGPACVPCDRMDDYFVALSAFERLLNKLLPREARLLPSLSPSQEKVLCDYAMESTWEQRLNEGEVLVFNNQRMLHGRQSFDMKGDTSGRHLVGCYTNLDDTLNQYRLLRRERMAPDVTSYVRCPGNGSSGNL